MPVPVTARWLRKSYSLPSYMENEKRMLGQSNPDFSLFWECRNCHSAIIFCLDICPSCDRRADKKSKQK